MKVALLSLITEYLSHEISAISGSYLIMHIGSNLDNTTTDPPIIHSNKVATTIDIWGKGDQNVSLGSMEIIHGIQRGGIGRSGNYDIRMNAPGTIGGSGPQGSGHMSFDIFDIFDSIAVIRLGMMKIQVKTLGSKNIF